MQVDGYSLDAQRDKIRKYAEYQDMTIVSEFSDEGFSGKNIKGRPEFSRMMKKRLSWSIRPDLPWEGNGSGYVVDCLRSAFMILEQASCYEDGVKRAVLLGNDTDTTACVAGGLLGILYGTQGIPDR